MKPPRLPRMRPKLPEPVSVLSLLDQNHWVGPVVPGRHRLVTWRTTMALLLCRVDIAPIAAGLWPALCRMADQIVERAQMNLEGSLGMPVPLGYDEWRQGWLDQLSHWHDPIRAMIMAHCTAGDAKVVAQHFAAFNGLAFADFTIEAVRRFDEHAAWYAIVMGEAAPLPSLPVDWNCASPRMAAEAVIDQLYADFQVAGSIMQDDAQRPQPLGRHLFEIYEDLDGSQVRSRPGSFDQ